jgi:tRNA(Arg) A34 adenosine deaminase TadA
MKVAFHIAGIANLFIPSGYVPKALVSFHLWSLKLTHLQAQKALETNETPVGCVFVHNGEIIGRGMNATNRTANGTRHAELVAIAQILSILAEPLPPGEMEKLV